MIVSHPSSKEQDRFSSLFFKASLISRAKQRTTRIERMSCSELSEARGRTVTEHYCLSQKVKTTKKPQAYVRKLVSYNKQVFVLIPRVLF